MVSTVVWLIRNLCQGNPGPDIRLVSQAIQPTVALLQRKNELSEDVLVDAAWAMAFLSNGENSRIGAVMANGSTRVLVSLLDESPSTRLLKPVLRCLCNFVTATDEQTQEVIDAGILKHVSGLLLNKEVWL